MRADGVSAEISFYPGWMMKNWLSINVDALIKTAELGDVTQQFNLGMMYMDGRNVARDPAEGMKWLRKAAQQGNASAQNNIGNFLMRNWHKEIPQDYAEAYFWHSLAAKADYYNNADEAAKHLTEEQIRQIDQRVSEWKPIPTNPSPELHFIQTEISDAEVSRAPTLDDFDPISEVIDMPISITIKTIPQLSEFKHGEKFTDLPGKNNLEEKKRLKGYLDKLTDKVISEISVNPSKLWLLKQFQIALIATQEEDTEAQEHFSAELIKLMNILGIQNSDGLIEYYRYGDLAYMLHEFKADKK
ncbi:MAG: DUF4844 domain-containing protein [Alphaproteobacteria bacterium]|nr:DUF4844 domain-containing protein [Alphaproteobacteria bacterium]